MYFSFWRRPRLYSRWLNSSCCQNVSDCTAEKCDNASDRSSWWWGALPEWENKQVSFIYPLFALYEKVGELESPGTREYVWPDGKLCCALDSPNLPPPAALLLCQGKSKIPSPQHTTIHFPSVFKHIALAICISLPMKFVSGLNNDDVDGHSSITASIPKYVSQV